MATIPSSSEAKWQRETMLGNHVYEVECKQRVHMFVTNATMIENHLLASANVKACSAFPEDVEIALRAFDNAANAAKL